MNGSMHACAYREGDAIAALSTWLDRHFDGKDSCEEVLASHPNIFVVRMIGLYKTSKKQPSPALPHARFPSHDLPFLSVTFLFLLVSFSLSLSLSSISFFLAPFYFLFSLYLSIYIYIYLSLSLFLSLSLSLSLPLVFFTDVS